MIAIDFKQYTSLDIYEFDILEEIPSDDLKDGITTKDEVIKLSSNTNNRYCDIIEYVGEHNDKEIWTNKSVSNSYYGDGIKYNSGFRIGSSNLDRTKRYIVLGNDDDNIIEFNNIFIKDWFGKYIKDFIETAYDKKLAIGEEFNSMSHIWNINIDVKDFIIRLKDCNDLEDVKKEYDIYMKGVKEGFIEYISNEKLTEEDMKKKQEEEMREKKRIYEEDSKADVNGWRRLLVDGKEISYFGDKFVLDKDVKDLLEYNWWNNIDSSYGDLNTLCYFLNDKKINYTYHKGVKDGVVEKYKIEFKNDKIIVDGVQIPKSKIVFFLKRADGKKETIKLLKKLSARAIELMDRTNIRISTRSNGYYESISLPFSAVTEDGKNFKINLMTNDYDIDFDVLKRVFFGSRISFVEPSIEEFCKFVTNDLGGTKTELFAHIKRIKLLESMSNEDN